MEEINGARVLTGYRPTGKMHIGHYIGNLQEMLIRQNESTCFTDCLFFIADWHALTTDYETTENIKLNVEEMIIDWLAAGIDNEKATVYRQSDIREIAEFNLCLSMITPLGWLERCPTYKEQLQNLSSREINTYGFMGYPVLQAADILIMHSDFVPVGEDQLPHLELTREIARRFNSLYGKYMKEPKAILGNLAKVPGTDGRKMSKSYGNQINLTDKPSEILEKVKMMITDPARVRRNDKGHPEVCNVYDLQKIFASSEHEDIAAGCRSASIGCIDCKKKLAETLSLELEDFRERREEIEKDRDLVWDILEEGERRVKPIASDTVENVRRMIGID